MIIFSPLYDILGEIAYVDGVAVILGLGIFLISGEFVSINVLGAAFSYYLYVYIFSFLGVGGAKVEKKYLSGVSCARS